MHYDFILVGQGIAGTLLAYFLTKNGQRVLVLDDEHRSSSTKAAAGIMNPITGRRYVKSWRYDDLFPFAVQTYRELDELLQTRNFEERGIARALFNNGEVSDFYARTSEKGYADYILDDSDLGDYSGAVRPMFAVGEVRQSGRVNVRELIAVYRDFLLQKGQLQTLSFDYSTLKIEPKRIIYDTWTADKLVFCEGSKAKMNPFFNYLPFRGAKGEILIVEIPNFEPQRILKHQVFFVPMGNHRFWIGATAQNHFADDAPSDYGRAYLTEKLDKILTVPYRIIAHEAGVRPTVKDRRPFLGAHPKFSNVFIFNGLGGKGSSLAPFFAQQLTDFLLNGRPLDAEVDIRRFEKP